MKLTRKRPYGGYGLFGISKSGKTVGTAFVLRCGNLWRGLFVEDASRVAGKIRS